MLWISIKRVTKAGAVYFWRNGFVSLASVLVMTVTLSVIGGVVFLLAVLDASLLEIKNKVDVNVYFVTSADEKDILALEKSLEALPEVKEVEYISRAQALDNFRKRHGSDTLVLQSLAELPDNPLGAVLTIRAKEPSQYESIANFLKSDSVLSSGSKSIIDEVNYYDNKSAIDKLSALIEFAARLGFTLTLILVAVSIIITFNTIRLAIYIAREEISVMRLVGASNKYIRGPFIVSGVLYGAVAGLITLAAFFPITYYLGGSTADFFSGLNIFVYYQEHFASLFEIIMGSGVALGAVSSYFAVRRYLNV